MIYLDNAASTRPYPEVIEIITDVLTNHWGNASSSHAMGDDARQIINSATQIVAKDLNCDKDEIIWTSGATESNSLAILGVNPQDLITTRLEHSSIYSLIEKEPFKYFYMFVDNNNKGFISLDSLQERIKFSKKTNHHFLASICFANSEIGVIQDIKSISRLVHDNGGLLHVDATQMLPEQSIDVKKYGIDLLSASGQKLGCCKGVGILYVRKGINLRPLIYGTQQNFVRGGTYPTHLIAAFGKALEVTREHNASGRIEELRNKLLNKLLQINGVTLNGTYLSNSRLKNNISITIDGVNAEKLTTLCSLQGICISKGSACNSYNPVLSQALLSIGLTTKQAFNTVRLTLNEYNTEQEIYTAANIITKLVERIRQDD